MLWSSPETGFSTSGFSRSLPLISRYSSWSSMTFCPRRGLGLGVQGEAHTREKQARLDALERCGVGVPCGHARAKSASPGFEPCVAYVVGVVEHRVLGHGHAVLL